MSKWIARNLDESYTFVSVPLDRDTLTIILKRATDSGLYLGEYIKFIIAEHEDRERIRESLDIGIGE